ncbi:WecB/TagA/CpsF family glycosyltransferase, partial [Candidatus Gracilibacteria bacterium]|nr:WecB/TagA/CpsF family glycosyltransferase [Candidatus Gracilibacteria bacterium]
QAVEQCSSILEKKTQHQIVTPNPEMLLVAQHDPHFKETLNQAWLSIPDGIGILWAAQVMSKHHTTRLGKILYGVLTLPLLLIMPRFFKGILPERVSGVDLMLELCAVSAEKKYRIFLLGAQEGVAEKVKTTLEKKYPHISIVGTHSGSPRIKDEEDIKDLIEKSRPDILFVAFGAPHQELWIARNLKDLPTVKIAMGVGGAFDFIAHIRKRAPKWMQKLGIEWLYRLIQEPRRIKRIFNAIIRFPFKVLTTH